MRFSTRSRFSLVRSASLTAVLLTFAGTAHSQLYWDNNGSSSGFGTAAGTWAAPTTNDATQGWSSSSTGATLPTGTTTTTTSDALNFGTSANQLDSGTITVSGNVSANTITIVGSSSNITLSGGNITLNGGLTATNSANTTASTDTITSNITLGGSQTWTVNNGGTVGTQNLLVSGNIIGGATNLTKSGNGTLTLSGAANSWNGTTTVSAGTLTLSGSLTSNANVALGSASGAVLNITGNFNQTKTSGGPRSFQLAVNAGTTGAINVSGAGILNIGTGMMLGDNGGGNGTFNISGGTVTNSGETWFAGANSTFNVSGGSYTASSGWTYFGGGSGNASTSTLSLNGTGTYTASTIDFGRGSANATTIINLGDGTAGGTLSVSGLSYVQGPSHTINFNGGTLNVRTSISMITQATTVVRSGGAVIDVNPGQTFTISNNLTNGGGGGGLTKNGTGILALSGNNSYTGATTINAGTLEVAGAGLLGGGNYAGNISNNATFLYNGTSSQTLSGVISGTGALTKNNTGTLILSGNNSYSGATTLNAGTLTISGDNTTNGTTTINGGKLNISRATALGTGTLTIVSGTLDNTSGSALTLANNNVQNWNGDFSYAGTNDLNLGSGAATLSASRTVTVSAGNLTVGGAISGGSFGFTKAGSGTLSLTGTGSSWNGTTAVTGGTLNLSGSLTARGPIYAAESSAGSVLNITGNLTQSYMAGSVRSFQIARAAGHSGSVTVGGSGILNLGAGMMFGDNNGGNATLNITGGTVNTNGDVWFAGLNNSLNVSSGTFNATSRGVELGGGVANGTSTITVNGTGSIIASGLTVGRTISSTTTINLGDGTAGGNLSISSLSPVGGTNTINFNGGTLNTSGNINFAAPYSTVVKSGGAVFNVTSNTLTISANLTTDGTGGGLTKNGAGTLALSGAGNTYTGTTTVNAGTLVLGANQNLRAIAGAGALNLSTFTLTTNASSDTTYSGVISGTGGLTKSGTGTLTLSNAANTYNGTTTINAGTLAVSGNISSSAVTINSGGVISAGSAAAVAKFNTASLTIGAGSGYALTIGNVNASVAGADYDQIAASGAVILNNTGASPFTVYLNGNPTGWNNASIYTWDIISAASLSGVFNSGNFTTDFTNFGIAEGNRTGTWSFTNPTGGTIRLTYTALAGNSTWNTGTGSWDTAAQWLENTVPNNGNSLIFNGAAGAATNNISNSTLTAVADISFASGAGAYTLAANSGASGASGGTPLAVTGTITNNSSNLQTINTDLAFNIGSTVNAASGNIAIGGVISGSAGITKTGNNALTISGANTYSGVTNLNAGTLNINNATALGNGTLTIAGGTIDNTSGAAITLTNNNTQNWNGDFTFAGTRDLNLGRGNVTMSASRTITVNAGNLTVLGNISGAGFGLTKNGSGTLTINASSAFSGAKTVNGGTLRLESALGAGGYIYGANSTININNGSTLQLGYQAGTASNPVFQGLIVNFDSNGGGTITLDGLNALLQTSTFTINSNGGAQNKFTSLNNGVINDQGGNVPVVFNVAIGTNATADFMVTGGLSNKNAITKNGAGKLLFQDTAVGGGSGIYNIIINQGTMEFGGTSTLNQQAGYLFSNNGTLSWNSTASQTLANNITGTGNLIKSNTNTLTLSGNNIYTGTTTISAGTLAIGNNMTIGAIAGTGGNLSLGTGFTLTTNASTNTTLSSVVQGSGNLMKSGTGTLSLAGNNNYSGNTTINTGTVVIGHANAAGTGRIVQTNGSSVLKIDTTGTISNNMSVYNVLASQSATLSGAIEVNNATWDVETGDTLTISGAVSGNGGVAKNGNGTLILSGSNSYAAPTVVNAGTLEAASTNALGSNNTVQITGGTLLVSVDDALAGKQIELSTNTTGLRFSGTYNGSVGRLTLSANSIIDLGPGSTKLSFHEVFMGIYYLNFYNWTGTTLWGGGTGADTDEVYLGTAGGGNYNLSQVRFYSGTTSDSFLGTGFDLGFDAGFGGDHIIPVPEPETWATGILLVLGGAVWLWKKRRIRI